MKPTERGKGREKRMLTVLQPHPGWLGVYSAGLCKDSPACLQWLLAAARKLILLSSTRTDTAFGNPKPPVVKDLILPLNTGLIKTLVCANVSADKMVHCTDVVPRSCNRVQGVLCARTVTHLGTRKSEKRFHLNPHEVYGLKAINNSLDLVTA